MRSGKVLLADSRRAGFWLRKLVFHLWEDFYDHSGLVLCGIERQGVLLAGILKRLLQEYARKQIQEVRLHVGVRKIEPVHRQLCEVPWVIVDDVIHTGRTMLSALAICEQSLPVLPPVIRTLVLVDRQNTRLYPVHPDYAGVRLSTTWHEFVHVELLPVLTIWLEESRSESPEMER